MKEGWGRQVGLCISAVLFLASGLAKLAPSPELQASLVDDLGMAAPLAIMELLIGAAFFIPAARTVAARAGSLIACAGVFSAVARMAGVAEGGCGCFGGWLVLAPAVQVVLSGLLLCLLARTAFPREPDATASSQKGVQG